MYARLTTLALLGALALLASGVAHAQHGEPAAGHTPAAAEHLDAAGDAHAAAHEPGLWEGGIGNAIVTAIIFGLVVLILGKTAWPKIITALDAREASIRESLESAHRQHSEADALFKKHQAAMEQARAEATAIVAEGRRDAEETRRRIAEEARKEADDMIARARREIQLAKDAAVKDLYDQVSEMSVAIAGNIVRKSLSADDHRALVRESIERMASATPGMRNN